MNVLLISANREQTPYPVFPIGLSYLAGPLAAAGHRLEALDLCFEKDPEQAVVEALDRFAPGCVVLSIRNIDNVTWPASRSYLADIRVIVTACRGRVPVVLGGSGFSLMPVAVLDYLDADFGVVGEGEEVLPLLLDALEQGKSPGPLPGLLVRGGKAYPPPRLVNSIGTPDRSLFLLERYNREGGMANLQTKRGCPFSCIYCTYPLLEGSRVRLRPIPEIIRELRGLVDEAGIDYVYFVDDIFNYPPDFAARLCHAITDERIAVKWTAFINPGFVDRSLLDAMATAGCDAIEFGSESGSPIMLENLGKSFGVEEIRNASLLCREAGLDFAHYLLFGGPGEDEKTIGETSALMDEIAPTAVIVMTGIRIFPGTSLYRRALAEGIVTPEAELLDPVFYISPLVGERLGALVTGEALKRRNWVVPGLEINMSDALLDMLRHFPVRGPLWKQVKRLGRSHFHPMSAQ